MKKLVFYIVENSNDNPTDIFFNSNKNSLLEYKNSKFYFNSLFNTKKEEIKVNFENIIFDETLFKNLCLIKEIAIKRAEAISHEEIGNEKNDGELNSIIHSEITKSYYENPNSIFEFIGNIFLKILMGHKLYNGNKRIALLFLIGSLRYFGYHFDWSKGIHQNYSFYKTEVEKFVEILENKSRIFDNQDDLVQNIERMYNRNITKINIEEIKSFIFEWIKYHSSIALEWR